MEKAYAHVLNSAYKVRTKASGKILGHSPNRSTQRVNDIARGRQLLLKEEIDAQDFREIKRENEKKIERLEARLIEVSSLSSYIEPLPEKAVSNLAHLDELYQDGDTKRKRTIIGSIYPEKLTFDGFQYRTTRVNEAVELIYTVDAGFGKKKQDKPKKILTCPVW